MAAQVLQRQARPLALVPGAGDRWAREDPSKCRNHSGNLEKKIFDGHPNGKGQKITPARGMFFPRDV